MTPPERSGLRARADRLDVERACATAFDPVTGHLSSRAMLEHLRAHASSGDVPLSLIVASVRPRDLPGAQGRFRGLDALDRSLTATAARHARTLAGVVATVDDGAVAVAVYGEEPVTLRRVVGELRAELADDDTLPHTHVTQATGTAREGTDLLARVLARRGADGQVAAARPDHVPLTVLATASRLPAARSTPAGRLLDPTTVVRGDGAATAVASRTGAVWDITDLLITHPGAWAPVLSSGADAPSRVAVRSRALAERPALAGGIQRLRESGVHVSLTGYGSGRDPLDSFDELPVDALALDHALVRGSRVSRADRAVLWSITSHARRYGLPLLCHDLVGPTRPAGISDTRWGRHGARAQAHLEDAWVAGLTAAETSLLLNAARERTADGRRWTRYEVALAWSSVF